MDAETIAVYEAEGADCSIRRGVQDPQRTIDFAATIADGTLRLDLGSGPGHHLEFLGRPAIAVDAARSMVEAARHAHPNVPAVQADLSALPFPTRSFGGVWASKAHQHLRAHDLPLALAELHRILHTGGRAELTVFALPERDRDPSTTTTTIESPPAGTLRTPNPRSGFREERSTADSGDDLPGRLFTWWEPETLVETVAAAGFDIDHVATVSNDPNHPQIHLRATAARRLPDHVGPNMRLLCCGLNPSLHAADAGIGYVSPSNRFWPALLRAGLTDRDRDPVHLLREHRIGMTDLVRRATPRASDLSRDEFRDGLERLRALCERHRPAAVAVIGLTGWRAAVDRDATAGWQPEPLGETPVYLLPSTSGLNAGTSLDELAAHLRRAADEFHRPEEFSNQDEVGKPVDGSLNPWLVARKSSPPSVRPPNRRP